jgi:hypothetical protein
VKEQPSHTEGGIFRAATLQQRAQLGPPEALFGRADINKMEEVHGEKGLLFDHPAAWELRQTDFAEGLGCREIQAISHHVPEYSLQPPPVVFRFRLTTLCTSPPAVCLRVHL